LSGRCALQPRGRPRTGWLQLRPCGFAWAELLARQPERTSIVGWLRVVARREAIRLARLDRVTVSMSAVESDAIASRARSTSCPVGDPSDRRKAIEALAALAGLPARSRTFLSAKVAGCSYDEIAAELEVSPRTVERQLVRARVAARAARDGV
jgi:RNA polymerase sigma factor (sigma-70 family)